MERIKPEAEIKYQEQVNDAVFSMRAICEKVENAGIDPELKNQVI